MSRVNVKVKLANAELSWHERLIDLGLKDGDLLVAEVINQGEQTETIEKEAAIPEVDQH